MSNKYMTKVDQVWASAPPTLVSAVTLAGVSLQDWVLIATLGWIVMQAAWFVYSKWKKLGGDE